MQKESFELTGKEAVQFLCSSFASRALFGVWTVRYVVLYLLPGGVAFGGASEGRHVPELVGVLVGWWSFRVREGTLSPYGTAAPFYQSVRFVSVGGGLSIESRDESSGTVTRRETMGKLTF